MFVSEIPETHLSIPRRILSALLLMLTFFTLLPSPLRADDATDDFDVAAELYRDERWALSAQAFESYLKKHPNHERVPIAKLYLGITLSKTDQYEKSRDIFRDYVKQYPTSQHIADARYRIARNSYLLGDYTAAGSEYAAFLKEYPQHDYRKWVLADYADVQLKLQKPETAATYFQMSLKEFPEGPMAEDSRFGLARAYEELKKYPEAIELYQQLSSDPKATRAAQSQLNLGAIYYETGKYDEAVETYGSFPTRYPQNPKIPQAQLNAGFALFQKRNYDAAIEQFELAALDPQQVVTAGYWKGLSLKSQGNFEQAVETFQATLKAAENSPLVENLLYHQADCQLREQKFEAARTSFLKVFEQFPKGQLADDSLLFAAEAALQEQKLDVAEKLIAQFSQAFPTSPLRYHHQLQEGRVLVDKGGTQNLAAALKLFQTILSSSQLDQTQAQARFQITRILQLQGKHAEALSTVQPLVDQVLKDQQSSTLVEALALQASSLLATEKFPEAAKTARQYLDWRPKGLLADQALITVALAELRQGNEAAAMAAVDTFGKEFPNSPLLAQTVYQLAEVSYQQQKWQSAEQFFQSLVDLGDSPYLAAGLSGLAWCKFQMKQFEEAAQLFARVVKDHSNKPEFAYEASYQYAHSLQEAGQLEKAAAAYQDAFQLLAPEKPAAKGEENSGKSYFSYRAGLQAARTLRQLKKTEEADAAYASLIEKFPQVENLDKLLDEWALLNYEAEKFQRSDEIFRRLIKDAPESPLVDDARLSLAESNLINGKTEQARQELQELTSSAKSDEQVKELAMFHLIRIDVEAASWKSILENAQTFLKNHSQSEFRFDVQYYLAQAALQLDRLDEAREALVKLKNQQDQPQVAQASWFPQVYMLLGEVYFRQKKYEQVEATATEFRTVAPNSPFLYQLDEILGRAYKNQAQFEKAREAFSRVLKSESGRRTETAAKAQFMIAETYLLEKNPQAAVLEYLKVNIHYKYPEWQAPALLQAGRCQEALNQPTEAVKTYQDLVRDFPNSEYATTARERVKELTP